MSEVDVKGLRFVRNIVVLSALLVVAFASSARADKPLMQKGQGMEARLFQSAVDTKGHFTLDATPVLPHKAISFGLVLDFGFHDWVAVEALNIADKGKGEKIYDLTLANTYISSVLSFNFGLFNHFVVGAKIPLLIPSGTAYSYGTQIGNGVPGEVRDEGWSTKGAIGGISLHVKFNILRSDRHGIGIGGLLQYKTPMGKPELLMADPGAGNLSGKVIVDYQPKKVWRIGLNVGAKVPLGFEKNNYLRNNFARPAAQAAQDFPDAFNDDPNASQSQQDAFGRAQANAITDNDRLLFHYGPMLTFGIGQSWSFWPEVMDLVVEVYGAQLASEFANSAYLSMEANVGVKMYIERNSYFMAGYAHGLPLADTPSGYGFQNVEHRAFLGFAFEPSINDRDGDGIPDDEDQCPDEPEDFDGFEDSDGCPDLDNDGDGILDEDDDCPNTPEDFDGDEDEDGCPEHGEGDRDGDGIPDSLDKCPDEPEDFDGFEDEDGCPDPDNDGDGILDVDDMCPNEPEDFDGYQDEDGCPDPDNDADRILDQDDECPNDPETYNGKDDEDGCPDKGDVVLTDNSINILKKVYFEYNSAEIKTVSYPILDAVAATIKGNPQIDKVEIQGHADERGKDNYNLRLTEQRAASVRKYLIQRGVPSNKLRSVGYGEYCPLDDASNEEAWEKNRRVEFKVLSIGGVPTGGAVSCDAARKHGIGSR